MKALIDGDIIVYRVGFGAQHVVWKKRLRFARKMRNIAGATRRFTYLGEEQVQYNINFLIRKILDKTEADEFTIYLSANDGSNFRNEIATIKPYKENRRKFEKPHYYAYIREVLLEQWKAVLVRKQEADDAMGIAATEHTIICTVDKDLDMVPGRHYNFVKDVLYEVSPFEGLRHFYKQLLMGDPTDNIPGIKGIGPKTAQKLLINASTEGEMYDIINSTYRIKLGLSQEEAERVILEVGRLLWIRRKEDEIWALPLR